MELSGVECRGTERDGVATLDRLAFGAFGGAIQAKGRVDHTGDVPAFSFQGTVRALDVGQALAARVPEMAERFDGRLDGDLTVSGRPATRCRSGARSRAWATSRSGTGACTTSASRRRCSRAWPAWVAS
jgi:uncharacterized protein involved in outer membrane biogenesis